jgi:adenylosuccinate synthase
VLDGLEKVGICTGYRINGEVTTIAPLGADAYAQCEPVIEYMAGWENSAGATEFDALPDNAKTYIARLEELVGVKITIISTGPDRDETIVLANPFA